MPNADPVAVLRNMAKAEGRAAARAGAGLTCLKCSKSEHAGDCASPRPLRKEFLQRLGVRPSRKAEAPAGAAVVALRLCEALSRGRVGGSVPEMLAQVLKGQPAAVAPKTAVAKALREGFPDRRDPMWTWVRVVAKAGGAAGGAPSAGATSAPGAPVATSTVASVGGPKPPKPKKPKAAPPTQVAREQTFGVNTAAAAPAPRASRAGGV
jgi:hypothetical protein